ncbi:MAG: Hsp20/alpha crystallin family protein [Clostridiales bacterium]|nr:Hsp20/alpha crystallin family protein [Clostridiales bacterium]
MTGLVPFNRSKLIGRRDGFENFYNMLDDFFSDEWVPQRSLMSKAFKIDVKEEDMNYRIEAELPGIKKDEINIEMNDGSLTISVIRDEEINEDKENYIHRERKQCSMKRSIYLADAKNDNIKAKLNDGILLITVPKTKDLNRHVKVDIE